MLLTTIKNEVLNKIVNDSPTLKLRFENHMLKYLDKDMLLRYCYVKNIPIMRRLTRRTIRRLAMKLNTTMYM